MSTISTIDLPEGGRTVFIGEVEEGSRDLELILAEAWPCRCAGTRQLSRHRIGGKSWRVRMSHEGQCRRERKGD